MNKTTFSDISLQRFLPIVLALGLAVLLIYTSYPHLHLPKQHSSDLQYLPQANYIRFLSLNQTESAASLLWVSSLIHYGSALFEGQEFQWLVQYAHLTTTLDSLFYNSYYLIGAVIPLNQADTTDLKVLRQGHQVYPQDWRLALFLALRLAEGPLKDYQQAAQVMNKYTHDPDVPDYIRRVSQTFLIQGAPLRIALSQLLEQYLDPRYQAYQAGTQAKILKVLRVDKNTPEAKAFIELLHRVEQKTLSVEQCYQQLLAWASRHSDQKAFPLHKP